jgi:hypothetical protein
LRDGVKNLALLVGVMLVFGVLTAGFSGSVPTIIQTTDPAASAFEATPEQAALFVFWVFFVLANMIVVGAILAGLFYLGNREVKKAEQMPNRLESSE